MFASFLLHALPWVAVGVTIILAVVDLFGKHSARVQHIYSADTYKAADFSDFESSGEEHGYMARCLGIGLCGGAAVGCLLSLLVGTVAFPYGICFGTLIGAMVGTFAGKD